MHTIWVRLNAVVFFGLTVLLMLSLFAAFIASIAHLQKPVVKTLQLNTLRSIKNHGGVDRALLSIDINVDMTPAFHWNVKQLFIYVVAIYTTDDQRHNTVVLWDKIIQATDSNKIIQEENLFIKYALIDYTQHYLLGQNITLQLQWDAMPITGTVYMDKQPIDTCSYFILPNEYQ